MSTEIERGGCGRERGGGREEEREERTRRASFSISFSFSFSFVEFESVIADFFLLFLPLSPGNTKSKPPTSKPSLSSRPQHPSPPSPQPSSPRPTKESRRLLPSWEKSKDGEHSPKLDGSELEDSTTSSLWSNRRGSAWRSTRATRTKSCFLLEG